MLLKKRIYINLIQEYYKLMRRTNNNIIFNYSKYKYNQIRNILNIDYGILNVYNYVEYI
jgi:hypothetical protein